MWGSCEKLEVVTTGCESLKLESICLIGHWNAPGLQMKCCMLSQIPFVSLLRATCSSTASIRELLWNLLLDSRLCDSPAHWWNAGCWCHQVSTQGPWAWPKPCRPLPQKMFTGLAGNWGSNHSSDQAAQPKEAKHSYCMHTDTLHTGLYLR